MNFLTGQILPFDKPLNMTSFQLVAKVRWLISQVMGGKKIKVGHAGTLDPLACSFSAQDVPRSVSKRCRAA